MNFKSKSILSATIAILFCLPINIISLANTSSIKQEQESAYQNDYKSTEITLMATPVYYEEYGIYFDSGTGSITSADKDIKNLILPQKIDGINIISINNNAFENCTELLSIVLPNNLSKIGNFAFQGCTSLTSVSMQDSITDIGYRAFSNCTSLENIIIPPLADTITNNNKYYYDDYSGEWVYGCSNLSEITISDGATKIPKNAFRNCTFFTEINIPDSVTVIDVAAFANCTQLTELPIMNGVTAIKANAFYNCKNIENLNNILLIIKLRKLFFGYLAVLIFKLLNKLSHKIHYLTASASAIIF